MPYVGNDIVDLKNPDNMKSILDSRFRKKILTAAEIEFVQSSKNPVQTLWSFWTCKETAYKIRKKHCTDISFLPGRWEVCLAPPDKRYTDGEIAVSASQKVYLRLFFNDDYIHCIGTDEFAMRGNIICGVAPVPEPKDGNGHEASSYVRSIVAQKLGEFLSVNPADIEIKRKKVNGELQPPRIATGVARSGIDISMSHDGRFVAYAFLS